MDNVNLFNNGNTLRSLASTLHGNTREFMRGYDDPFGIYGLLDFPHLLLPVDTEGWIL